MNVQVFLLIEAWAKCPLPIIPEEKRVKGKQLGICKGNCNGFKPIHNSKYQLCGNCSNIYRFHGASCDVPNCDSVADGEMRFHTKENKIVCNGCYKNWMRKDFCVWERFVEERHLYLLKPEPFVKALEEGIVSEVENPVPMNEVAECSHCHRYMQIKTPKYQLCSTCMSHLTYHGHECFVCEADAKEFVASEGIMVCGRCNNMKRNYNISSFMIYKTQVRTIHNCMICKTEVSHEIEEGKDRKSAYIDHDHETGEVRGVLCHKCNSVEGIINKMDISVHTFAKRLKDYIENPPLSQTWMQND